MATWQLQDAKARFSEVVETAEKSGPQIVTRRGVATAVVMSFAEWEKSQGNSARGAEKQKPGILSAEERRESAAFLKLLQSCPDFEIPRRTLRMSKPVKF